MSQRRASLASACVCALLALAALGRLLGAGDAGESAGSDAPTVTGGSVYVIGPRAVYVVGPLIGVGFFCYRASSSQADDAPTGGKGQKDGDVFVFAFALFQFVFSSVGMMSGNKMAVELLADKDRGVKLPTTLVILQLIGTVMLLTAFWNQIDEDKLTLHCAKAWMPIFTLFAGMLYTSAKTFVYVHVSFVIVMRNVGAIITTFLEYFTRGVPLDVRVLLSELVIVLGTVMYGWSSMGQFKDFGKGLFWCITNVCFQCCYGVILKYQMDNHSDIKDMSKYTMSLFNNLLCLPYFLAIAGMSGEVAEIPSVFPIVSTWGWGIVCATCLIGFVISTSGFGLQKLVSATTFIVINNLCKILNILLGVVLLGDRIAGRTAAIGCCVSLLGGFWYSVEVMRAGKERKAAAEAAAAAATPKEEPSAVEPRTAVESRPGAQTPPDDVPVGKKAVPLHG